MEEAGHLEIGVENAGVVLEVEVLDAGEGLEFDVVTSSDFSSVLEDLGPVLQEVGVFSEFPEFRSGVLKGVTNRGRFVTDLVGVWNPSCGVQLTLSLLRFMPGSVFCSFIG